LFGQIETTQYFMNTLPQVVDSNPAFLPKFSYAIGLPFSRVSANYANNGFAYNDAIRLENGKRVFDVARWTAALPEKTYVTSASQVDLFRLGIKVGANVYVSLHSSAREATQAMFPKDIAVLLAGGTAAYVGKTASLAPHFDGMTFWETGVGISAAPTEKLRLGFKLKKVYGAHALKTEKAELLLSVGDNYEMNLSADAHIMTSGLQDSTFNFRNYLSNSGWSGDLGFTYQLLPKLTLAASVVDIGYIKWRNNLVDYKINKDEASYSFSGFEMQDLLEGNTSAFEQQLDSLMEDFKPQESAGTAFSMMLPAKFYASISYNLMESFTVGGLFIAENYNGHTGMGWTTSLNKNFGRWLSTSISYTVSHRSYNNLGAGIALKLGPLQVYAVGDNVVGLPVTYFKTGNINAHMNKAHLFNGRAGINFVWGWKKGSGPKQEVQNESYNGKKDNTKQIKEDNSKSYNGKKSSSKATTNKKKQPQPAHMKARQKKN
jgi:hypothetical protein